MPFSRPSSLRRASSAAGESFLPSIATGSPRSNVDRDHRRLVGRRFRIDGARIDVVRHLDAWVLQHLALGGGVQEVGVDRERRLAALVLGDRDLVQLGERDELLARAQIPFAPGRDHGDVGLQRVVGELEADLVVALAGRAVGDGVGADLLGDLDLLLGDERAGDRGAEEIEPLVLRVRPEHREDVVAHELLAQILDEDVLVLDAEELRLAPRRLELLALAEIGREGHDLAAVGGLQPFQDDRGVEPAGIGEHDLLDGAVGHERLWRREGGHRPRSAEL